MEGNREPSLLAQVAEIVVRAVVDVAGWVLARLW